MQNNFLSIMKIISLISFLIFLSGPASATSPESIPEPVTNLQASIVGFDSARFSWNAPVDANYGTPVAYHMFLDGEFVREITGTSFSIGGRFNIDTMYQFGVESVYESNIKGARQTVQFTTVDYTVSNLRAEVYSDSAVELFWDREQFVTSKTVYDVYRNGQLQSSSNGNSFFDSSLSSGTSYTYEVFIRVVDKQSSPASVSVTTLGGTGGGGGQTSCDNDIAINNEVISWPDNGWYQVQSAIDYQTFCEGGTSCAVPAGLYNVINLSSGIRCENIAVENGSGGGGESLGGPLDPRIVYYSSTAIEMFWMNASDSVISTEVYRDGVLLDVTNGNSYFDASREQNRSYQYSLVSVNADNQRSEEIFVGGSTENARILPDTPAPSIRSAVALDGGTLAIGHPEYSSANGTRTGKVTVYTEQSENVWVEWQTFEGSNASAQFGERVKFDNGSLLISGKESLLDDGSVVDALHIYERMDSGIWTHFQSITSLRSDNQIAFNNVDSFDIDDNTLFIGSTVNDSVYVYTREVAEATWSQQQVLSREYDIGVFGEFGSAVAINGDTALIGASGSEERGFNAGSVYVYTRDATGIWSEQGVLFGSALRDGSAFGGSIEMQGNTAVIGGEPPSACSPFGTQNGRDVYIFTRNSNGQWSESQRLVSSHVEGGDVSNAFVRSEMFGISIALEENTLVVGAAGADGLSQASGSAYIFKRDDQGTWSEFDRLVASNGSPGARFGTSVSVSGGTVAVGQGCGGVNQEGFAYTY